MNIMGTRRTVWLRWGLAVGLPMGVLGVGAGCNVLGLASYIAPSPTINAAYKGLAGQRVAVMVWTDGAMKIDWPTLQLDVAHGIDSRVEGKAKEKGAPSELKGTTFAMPESVLRFQRDHPETETQAITDVAPRMD